MKIRSDYVSNSSSSSFMIVGGAFAEAEIMEFGRKHGLVSDDDDDIFDAIDKIVDKFGLSCERGIENYYDEWCIGLHYGDMKDSETKKEFENRISEKLQELTGKKCDVDELVDGGMDC